MVANAISIIPLDSSAAGVRSAPNKGFEAFGTHCRWSLEPEQQSLIHGEKR